MLIERRQLKKIFFKILAESFFPEDEMEYTEEVIRWYDPKREEKIAAAEKEGRDYVIQTNPMQNLDDVDVFSMSYPERRAYVMAMADKLSADFEERQSALAREREERNRAQIDRIIRSNRPESTGVLGSPYGYSDEEDTTETDDLTFDYDPTATFKLDR